MGTQWHQARSISIQMPAEWLMLIPFSLPPYYCSVPTQLPISGSVPCVVLFATVSLLKVGGVKMKPKITKERKTKQNRNEKAEIKRKIKLVKRRQNK